MSCNVTKTICFALSSMQIRSDTESVFSSSMLYAQDVDPVQRNSGIIRENHSLVRSNGLLRLACAAMDRRLPALLNECQEWDKHYSIWPTITLSCFHVAGESRDIFLLTLHTKRLNDAGFGNSCQSSRAHISVQGDNNGLCN